MVILNARSLKLKSSLVLCSGILEWRSYLEISNPLVFSKSRSFTAFLSESYCPSLNSAIIIFVSTGYRVIAGISEIPYINQ